MSYFAKVLNNKVIEIISAESDYFDTFIDTSPGTWIQTSYNTKGGIHYGSNGQADEGIALRGNYAGLGYIYDSVNDVFYAPQPFSSWVLNQTTWSWEAPTPMPIDDKLYKWDEPTLSWVEIQ